MQKGSNCKLNLTFENNNKKIKIWHFSDLHFGDYSIEKEIKFPTEFSSFFTVFHDYLEYQIKNQKPALVLLSGDVGSIGIFPDKGISKSYLDKFLKTFADESIPILFCNGNHDLQRQKIKSQSQFEVFIKNILAMQHIFGCIFSQSFSKNLSCYVFLKDVNCLFLSLNTCQDIEAISVGKTPTGKTIMDENKLNQATFPAAQFKEILAEIKGKQNISEECFKNVKVFLVMHHPFSILENPDMFKKFLENNNVQAIFSGHVHHFKYDSEFNNFTAGSLTVKKDERERAYTFSSERLQFNEYHIGLSSQMTIKCYIHKLEIVWKRQEENTYLLDEKGWKRKEKQSIKLGEKEISYEEVQKQKINEENMINKDKNIDNNIISLISIISGGKSLETMKVQVKNLGLNGTNKMEIIEKIYNSFFQYDLEIIYRLRDFFKKELNCFISDGNNLQNLIGSLFDSPMSENFPKENDKKKLISLRKEQKWEYNYGSLTKFISFILNISEDLATKVKKEILKSRKIKFYDKSLRIEVDSWEKLQEKHGFQIKRLKNLKRKLNIVAQLIKTKSFHEADRKLKEIIKEKQFIEFEKEKINSYNKLLECAYTRPLQHSSPVNTVDFSPDGKYLVSGSDNGDIIIWDAYSDNKIREKNIEFGIHSLCFSPNGQYIASLSADKIVRLWKTSDLFKIEDYPLLAKDPHSVIFSNDGKYIIGGSWQISLWNINNNKYSMSFISPGRGFESIKYSPQYNHIACICRDRLYRISFDKYNSQSNIEYDIDDSQHFLKYESGDCIIRAICYSPKGEYIACVVRFPHYTYSLAGVHRIELVNANTLKIIKTIRFGHFYDPSDSIAYSSDGKYIANGLLYGDIKIWDSKTGKHFKTLKKHSKKVTSLAFSKDGYLACASADHTISIYYFGG